MFIVYLLWQFCSVVNRRRDIDPLDPTYGDIPKTLLNQCFFSYSLLQLSNCDVCQHMNKNTTGTPQLNPIPVKSPWYMVGIDYVGPLSPVADDGSHYILTVTDYFTKWCAAIATLDKSAASTSAALFKVQCTI